MSSADKNPANVMRGLKAAINNPNVSEEAKDNAQEKLNEMTSGGTEEVTHVNHVLGGYKATLNNDNTSDEAKAHAREVLEAAGVLGLTDNSSQQERDEHEVRVLAGYKAALHNPNVSDAAKEHAKQFLKEHNAL